MHVITDNNERPSKAVEIACIDFLATLCVETKKGRCAISEAELCNACIDFASKTILQLINTHDKKSANVESNPRFQENQKEMSIKFGDECQETADCQHRQILIYTTRLRM